MEILVVEASAGREFKYSVVRKEVIKETGKQYKVRNGVINKDKILNVTSLFINSVSSEMPRISYYTYCLEEDLEKAKEMLHEAIVNRVKKLEIGVNSLIESLKK